MKDKHSKILKKHGVFFAFSNERFHEQRDKRVKKYVNCGYGMFCPKNNLKSFIKELSESTQQSIKEDLNQNGKEKIIKRELNNFEVCYTGDITPVVEALKDYGITREEIEIVNKHKKLK